MLAEKRYTALLAAGLAVHLPATATAQELYELSIPALPLREALKLLGRQTGHSLLLKSDAVERHVSRPLSGRYDLENALKKILKGTQLEGLITKSGVLIVKIKSSAEEDNNMKILKRSVVVAGLIASTHPMVGRAQTASDATARAALPDIVVTARKQNETLISVPVAVDVVTGDTLQSTATSDMTKLDAVVPQLRLVQANSGAGAAFSIRGIGSAFFDAGVEQSVSIAIDGIQIGRGNIITQSFFDVSQIEVLKGPQELFFGKNSPAGVVSIKSKNPSNKLEGYVTAGCPPSALMAQI